MDVEEKCLINLAQYDIELKQKHAFRILNLEDEFKMSTIEIKVNEYVMNLVSDYVASGFAKVLKDWFEDPGKLSSNDVAHLISALIYNGIKGVLNYSLVIN